VSMGRVWLRKQRILTIGRTARFLLLMVCVSGAGLAAAENAAPTRETVVAALEHQLGQLQTFVVTIHGETRWANGETRYSLTTVAASGESRRVEEFTGAQAGEWTTRRIAVWHDGALSSLQGDPEFEVRAVEGNWPRWRAQDLLVAAEPLTALALYDAESGAAGGSDLPSLLASRAYPFGERKEVDGADCLVLDLLGRRRYYLDERLGFAVRRIDSFTRDGDLQSRVANDDFEEVSGGLWVPRRVTRTVYSQDAEGVWQEGVSAYTVHAFELAPELAEDTFVITVDHEAAPTVAAMPEPRSEPAQAPVDPLAVGNPAPLFQARTVDGRTIRLSDYRGKVVLIDFWATWCGPCVAGKPKIIEAHKTYRHRGLEVIGVSLDSNGKALATFLQRNQDMTWPNIFEGRGSKSAIGQQYQVRAIPNSVLIDAEGIIRYRNPHRGQLNDAIETLLAELAK